MEDEPEVTRAHMDETRASLTEKLETLEQQVVGTVQGATAAVAETVDSVKEAVAETVEVVKDTFDLPLQARRHPWGVVAGSIALGYLGGYLLLRNRSSRSAPTGRSQPAPLASPKLPRQQNGAFKDHRPTEEPSVMKFVAESPGPAEPGWLNGLTDQFGPEITRLKGLAIGTALGVVRDLITQSVSDQMRPQLAEVMDNITAKLGGEPVLGRILDDGPCANAAKAPEFCASELGRSSRAG